MASIFAVDYSIATFPAWASFLTAPAGPRIHTNPRVSGGADLAQLYVVRLTATFLCQGVPYLVLGNGNINSHHPCFRGPEGRRHTDLVAIQDPHTSCAANLFWSSENSSTTAPVMAYRIFSAFTPTPTRGMLPLAAVNTSA
jgi:hypothetical protein